MNQLYIIGNGFDLAHGMKTSYNDFITWYLNKVYTRLVTHGQYQDELLEVEKKLPLAEIELLSIEVFLKLKNDKIVELNIKSAFLRHIFKVVSIHRWVDIERLYFNQLLYHFNSRNNGQVAKDGVVALNKDFGIITAMLKEYIASIDIKKVESIGDVHQALNHLFTRHKIGTNNEMSALFLNFNYTDTLDLYNNLTEKHKARIIHIHGKATAVNDNIIFGYGDEMNDHYVEIEKLNDNEYLRHFKSFNYFNSSNYRNFLNFMEIGLFKVYIMGHSCGLSDRILLNGIFEHEKCSEIQIFYHDKGKGQNDFVEKTYEISRHFSGAKKGVMRARILPFDRSDPLVRANQCILNPSNFVNK